MTPLQFAKLFEEFGADSWSGWRSLLEQVTPGVTREFWAICGRGAGKSRTAALLASWAACQTYRRAAGEQVYVGVFAPDRKQARVTHKYTAGLLHSRPELRRLIVRETGESIELSTGVVVEVLTASKAAPRGRSYCLGIIEEAAFLPQDSAADPDVELLRALTPGLARVPGSLLVVLSSPYARRGILWDAWKRHRKGKDPAVVLVKAPTLELNPTFDARAVERAYAEDPAGAAAEYGAEFRADIESFVSREVIESAVVPGRKELPPVPAVNGRTIDYYAFADPSGGSGDSFTLAIGHSEVRDGQPVAIVDCLRERRAPFQPRAVAAEFAKVLATYGIRKVVGDRYAGEWPREAFAAEGITYEPAAAPKSDLYRDALAVLNSGRVELPDNDRLVAQLIALERKTARGGRDSIDHPPGAHDDLANAVAGLAVALVVRAKRPGRATWGRDDPSTSSTSLFTAAEKRNLLKQRREFGFMINRSR